MIHIILNTVENKDKNKMEETGLDNYIDERDRQLLEGDKYTFFVLGRVMEGDCELLLSDHKSLIICYTGAPFPVWIWTKSGASLKEMDNAYLTAKENGLVDGEHNFNMKYELADHFIKRASEDGIDLSVSINMFAYDCLNPIKPTGISDGSIHRCIKEDMEELTDFIDLFHREIGIDQKDRAGYEEDALNDINEGRTFFWKDASGKNVASCKYGPNGNMASINLVFTRHDSRRKHYAENLVYQVTMLAKEEGFVPMLYTNADYVASNACYEKIGYVLRGKLCTIGGSNADR